MGGASPQDSNSPWRQPGRAGGLRHGAGRHPGARWADGPRHCRSGLRLASPLQAQWARERASDDDGPGFRGRRWVTATCRADPARWLGVEIPSARSGREETASPRRPGDAAADAFRASARRTLLLAATFGLTTCPTRFETSLHRPSHRRAGWVFCAAQGGREPAGPDAGPPGDQRGGALAVLAVQRFGDRPDG